MGKQGKPFVVTSDNYAPDPPEGKDRVTLERGSVVYVTDRAYAARQVVSGHLHAVTNVKTAALMDPSKQAAMLDPTRGDEL